MGFASNYYNEAKLKSDIKEQGVRPSARSVR